MSELRKGYYAPRGWDVDTWCITVPDDGFIIPPFSPHLNNTANSFVAYERRLGKERVVLPLAGDWISNRDLMQWRPDTVPFLTDLHDARYKEFMMAWRRMIRNGRESHIPEKIYVENWHPGDHWDRPIERGLTLIHGRKDSDSENREVFIIEKETRPPRIDDMDQGESLPNVVGRIRHSDAAVQEAFGTVPQPQETHYVGDSCPGGHLPTSTARYRIERMA
jgi:hypothetical protein